MLAVWFGLYLLAIVLVCRRWSGRMADTGDFYLAGRRLGGFAVAVAFVAAWFGAGSTMGTLQDASKSGLGAVWLIAIPTLLTCVIVALFLARQVRQTGFLSLPEAMMNRYGPGVAALLAVSLLATSVTFMASQLVAAGQLLSATTPLPFAAGIVVILGAVILYSALGGFRAVVITDFCQGACYTLALFILCGVAIWTAVHGGPPAHPLPEGFYSPLTHWPHRLAMAFTFVLAWVIAPEMWQRMAATTDAQTSRRATWLAGAILLGLYALVITTGMLAARGHLPMAAQWAAKNPLIAIALALPGPILPTVVLLGILSAVTSTVDSSLNVASLTLSQDLIHRYWWTDISPRTSLLLSRVSLVLVSIPAAIIAIGYADIIRILWISADLYASTMFVPVMGLFYAPSAGRIAAMLSIALGAIPVILNAVHDAHWITLPAIWPAWPYTTLLGVALSVSGYLIGTCFDARGRQRQKGRSGVIEA